MALSVLCLVTGLSSGAGSCSYAYYKEVIIFLQTRFALEKAENVIENSDQYMSRKETTL